MDNYLPSFKGNYDGDIDTRPKVDRTVSEYVPPYTPPIRKTRPDPIATQQIDIARHYAEMAAAESFKCMNAYNDFIAKYEQVQYALEEFIEALPIIQNAKVYAERAEAAEARIQPVAQKVIEIDNLKLRVDALEVFEEDTIQDINDIDEDLERLGNIVAGHTSSISSLEQDITDLAALVGTANDILGGI